MRLASLAGVSLGVRRRGGMALKQRSQAMLRAIVMSVLRPGFETPGWAYSGGQL
jgi:hypothetical protein